MKKLFLVLMMSVCGMMAQAATKYEINVGGVEVTSDNCSYIAPASNNEITGGYAVYNPSTNTLTCYNITIRRSNQVDKYGIHNRKCDNLKIVFSGNCDVRASDNALKLERSTTLEVPSGSRADFNSSARIVINLKSYTYYIKGSGNLNVESNVEGYEAIKGDGSGSTTVYFQGAKVTAKSYKRSALSSFKAVFNEGAELTIYANGSNTSVSSVSMTFNGRETVLSPYGAYYSNSAIYTSSGSQVTSQDIYISDQYVAKLSSDYFPDANFRYYLSTQFPKGYITTSDVNATTSLNASSEYISNLQGLGYFTKLVNFACEENNLTSLPSLPSTLKTLNCRENKLTSLPSMPSGLTLLVCDHNQLTMLPTFTSSLQTLECENNKLTGSVNLCNLSGLKTLKISNNPSITTLNCYNNALTSLDVTGCTGLTTLKCGNNQLTTLDISALNNLANLNCSNNKLTGSFNYNNHSSFKTLDISDNPIKTLNCYNNALTSLIVSGCVDLTALDCHNNNLTAFTSLDNDLPSKLQTINCSHNQLDGIIIIKGLSALKTLDINTNPDITKLECNLNALTSLNVENCSAMSLLNCKNNQLTSLSLAGCTSLKKLICSYNQLSLLSNLPGNLQSLDCSYNKFTSLSLSGCSALTRIDCYDNQLTSLSNLPSTLESLYCYDNYLTSLNVSNMSNLYWVNCSNNKLTSLDVSNKTKLKNLLTSDNQLTSLQVQGCSALEVLDCEKNKLSSLSVQGCNALRDISCYVNQIKESGAKTLVNSLCTIPAGTDGNLSFVFPGYSNDGYTEGNVIAAAQVMAARAKRWIPKKYENGVWKEIPSAGDVNGDGKINVSDVTTLVNMILGVIPKDESRADINGDGKVNVSDVTALVNIILGVQ